MPRDDLARAYLRQAAEDLEAAKAVAEQGTAYSTLCMLLHDQRSRASEGGEAFARHGQLEYPWWEGENVRWPARDLNLAKELRDPKSRWGLQLLRLADELVSNFDDIFG